MYIQHKTISAFYKLSLGLISVYGFWMTLAAFGVTAWRLFSTWALLIGALYFCVSALILALSGKRAAGYIPCPMLEGMLIIAFFTQMVAMIACAVNDEYLTGLSGFAAILAYCILPVLTLLDWCLFNKKGAWRATDPFHWLAFPLSYAAMIIFTANLLPSSASLRYPVAFLDYNTNGFWEMLSWLAFFGVLILIFGYVLILVDAFTGGIIARHIVLPHIRTVTVDDERQSIIDNTSPQAAKSPAQSQPSKPPKFPQPSISKPSKPSQPHQPSRNQPKTGRKINDITKPKSNNQPNAQNNPQSAAQTSNQLNKQRANAQNHPTPSTHKKPTNKPANKPKTEETSPNPTTNKPKIEEVSPNPTTSKPNNQQN